MGNKKQRQISLPLLVRRKPVSGELRRPFSVKNQMIFYEKRKKISKKV